MSKLVVTTFVTLDGVMQAPGGAGEDPSGGFTYEGWLVPFFDEAMGEQVTEWFTGAEDFLLGRTTYDIFYASWPKMISDDPVSQGLNFKPKHVASRTLTSVEWETADLLGDDVPGAIRALKEKDGGELQVHGSAGLIQTLLAEDLIDELRLIVFPVALAQEREDAGQSVGHSAEYGPRTQPRQRSMTSRFTPDRRSRSRRRRPARRPPSPRRWAWSSS